MLRCGQAGAGIRSARGSLYENEVSKYPQQSPPPMGNRNRPIGPSNGSGRAHYPSGGRHDIIWLRVYDPIFVVSGRAWVFI